MDAKNYNSVYVYIMKYKLETGNTSKILPHVCYCTERPQVRVDDIIPGFERLPSGANPLEPGWIEMQRRYAHLPPGTPGAPPGGPPGPSHLPGVYPPASLASDLIQRERERIERLGKASVEKYRRYCSVSRVAVRDYIQSNLAMNLNVYGGGRLSVN